MEEPVELGTGHAIALIGTDKRARGPYTDFYVVDCLVTNGDLCSDRFSKMEV